MALKDKTTDWDPVFLHARREARFILVTFAVFAIYTLSVSYGLGLNTDPDMNQPPPQVLGIPSWVFWGIVLPWIAANFVTAWFCFGYMRIDPIEEADASGDKQSTDGVSPQAADHSLEDDHV